MKGYHLHLKPGDRPTEVSLQKLHFQCFKQPLSLGNQLLVNGLLYSSF